MDWGEIKENDLAFFYLTMWKVVSWVVVALVVWSVMVRMSLYSAGLVFSKSISR